MKKANYDFEKLSQMAKDIITSTDLATVEREFYPMTNEEIEKYAKEYGVELLTEYTEWYAIQRDEEDNDWGDGSFSYDEAVEMAKAKGYKIIATISGAWDSKGQPLTEGSCTAEEEVE